MLMFNRNRVKVFFAGVIAYRVLSSVWASAAEVPTNSLSKESGDFSVHEEDRPFALFGSIGSGYGLVWGNGYSNSPSGPQFLLSALGAARVKRWEFDGGVSWLYSSISGQAAAGVPVSVKMRAGTFDLGARYRLGSRWQIGPALNLAYGTDTTLGPDVGSAKGTLLVGAKAVYELPKTSFPFRFWVQTSTETAFEHPLVIALAGLQIGIPIRLSGHKAIAAQEKPEISVRTSQAAPDKTVRVVLDSQRVFFNTASSKLRPEVARILKDVGGYLKADQPSKVKVSGHADRRGRFEMNLKLSKKRAESVRDALANGGVEKKRFDVEAYSYLVPIDPEQNKQAWAKNRRVEIVFEDVRDPERLRQELSPLSSDAPKESQ